MYLLKALILVALSALVGYGQGLPAPSEANQPGHVFVYRYKQYTGKLLKPSVYVDEKEVIKMENGRVAELILPPGQHTIRSNDKQSGITLDVKPGSVHYIRVDIASGLFKGHGRVALISPEQGGVEIDKLQEINPKHIKARSMVK